VHESSACSRAARLNDAAKKLCGRNPERPHQPGKGRQAYLSLAAFDSAHLDGRKSSLLSKVLLRPAARKTRLADVRSEALDGIHSRPCSGD
jgi:hypothetical protein